jgi:hypothetical protein
VQDFILRRKNSIVMKQVPYSVSPKVMIEKLNLDLGSFIKIFDFKVSEIKNEAKFITIANKLIKKEIHSTSELIS